MRPLKGNKMGKEKDYEATLHSPFFFSKESLIIKHTVKGGSMESRKTH